MKKKVALSVAGLVLMLAIFGGVKASQIGAMISAGESFSPPPIAVSTATVEEQTWEPNLRAIGTVAALRSIMVAAEVPGLVTKRAFESGKKVNKGALLLQLDASIERAQLESAKASLELAEINLKRANTLAASHINTPAEVDAALGQAKQLRAQVENVRAQLAKKTIRAPFAGTLGITQVEMGEIIAAGKPLVSLTDASKVYVDFFLPQRNVALVSLGQVVRVTSDGHGDREWSGSIEAIEPVVDASTRNIKIRAIFDNQDQALRAGLSASVKVVLPQGPPSLVVPATSVVYAPYGNAIYVVKDKEEGEGKSVTQTFVKLGERRGDFVAVLSGLTKDQTIVTTGGFKLSNGAAVTVDNDKGLDPSLKPQPENE